MKKLTLFLIALCLLSSCKKNDESTEAPVKTYDIKYNGGNVVNIVLKEELNLNATCDYKLSYYSDNELIVTVDDKGNILGKNIGETNITISNPEEHLTLKVIVSLYEEPTTNFYISQDELNKIYGTPNHIVTREDTTVFVYGGGADWVSYAVWEMDFFFINNEYIEADLYIISDVEPRLDEFLNNNYYYRGNDTINGEIYYTYLNEKNPEDATVLLGKINNVGQYNDICVFYIPYEYEGKTDYKGIIRKRYLSRN